MTRDSAWKRSYPLQEKAVEDIARQIAHVASGLSADGGPSLLKPLALSSAAIEAARPGLNRLLRNLAYYKAPEPLSDETRSALIWKYLAFARRCGEDQLLNPFGVVVIAWFVARRPRFVTGKASLGAIFEQALQAHRRHCRERRERRRSALAAQLRQATRPPLRPIVWKDGDYRLESLIHPYHLWEEGMAHNNCLSCIVPHLSSNHPANAITPETLPAIAFWRHMTKKKAHIFSLRKGRSRRGVVMMNRTSIFEMQVSEREDRDVLARAITDLKAANTLAPLTRAGRTRA